MKYELLCRPSPQRFLSRRNAMTDLNLTKICPVCNLIFSKPKRYSKKQWEGKTYCSCKCGGIRLPPDQYRQSVVSLILNNSKKSENGCIEHQGYCGKLGYGHSTYYGRCYPAHRLLYILINGDIPKDMHVLHSCDNPKCVNINHLFIGTHQCNMSDKVSKNRQYHKIGKHEIQDIVDLAKTNMLYAEIAKKYNVSQALITTIARKNGVFRDKKPTPYYANVMEMVMSGIPYADIGKKHGLSRCSISNIAVKHGIRKNRRGDYDATFKNVYVQSVGVSTPDNQTVHEPDRTGSG
jgi:hypothetical protein